jgi:hypothetical protein
MTLPDYFIGKSGKRYAYADDANLIRDKAPETLGKHISIQLAAIGLLEEFQGGVTPCGLPFTFAGQSPRKPFNHQSRGVPDMTNTGLTQLEPSADLPTPFDAYEIHGIKAYGKGSRRFCEQVDDAEAEFWSLFGHIPGQGLDCIGDFATREHAEEVFARITGIPFDTARDVARHLRSMHAGPQLLEAAEAAWRRASDHERLTFEECNRLCAAVVAATTAKPPVRTSSNQQSKENKA